MDRESLSSRRNPAPGVREALKHSFRTAASRAHGHRGREGWLSKYYGGEGDDLQAALLGHDWVVGSERQRLDYFFANVAVSLLKTE